MKKFLFLIPAILLFPAFASAASVLVFPYIENSHDGDKSARDITVCIERGDGTKDCGTTVPKFEVPAGVSYSIVFSPPTGYSYSSDGDCSGTPAGDEALRCNVHYKDGAPVVVAPQPEPVPSPVEPPVASPEPIATGGGSDILPAPIEAPAPVLSPVVLSSTTTEQSTTTLPAATTTIVVRETVIHEVIREVPVDSATTTALKAKVAELERSQASTTVRVNSLSKVLAWLVEVVRKIVPWFF